ncbi:Hypothetical protein PBC10988_35220 [Planctomycetales bacterium 10988]|nr:Hypothetical protein PBC10988_35220 [Planctomycetales bacterium 10988]
MQFMPHKGTFVLGLCLLVFGGLSTKTLQAEECCSKTAKMTKSKPACSSKEACGKEAKCSYEKLTLEEASCCEDEADCTEAVCSSKELCSLEDPCCPCSEMVPCEESCEDSTIAEMELCLPNQTGLRRMKMTPPSVKFEPIPLDPEVTYIAPATITCTVEDCEGEQKFTFPVLAKPAITACQAEVPICGTACKSGSCKGGTCQTAQCDESCDQYDADFDEDLDPEETAAVLLDLLKKNGSVLQGTSFEAIETCSAEETVTICTKKDCKCPNGDCCCPTGKCKCGKETETVCTSESGCCGKSAKETSDSLMAQFIEEIRREEQELAEAAFIPVEEVKACPCKSTCSCEGGCPVLQGKGSTCPLKATTPVKMTAPLDARDVESLRELSFHLEGLAHDLEHQNLYEQADQMRALAADYRAQARAIPTSKPVVRPNGEYHDPRGPYLPVSPGPAVTGMPPCAAYPVFPSASVEETISQLYSMIYQLKEECVQLQHQLQARAPRGTREF